MVGIAATEGFMKKMKRILVGLLAVVSVFASGIGLTACTPTDSSSSSTSSSTSVAPKGVVYEIGNDGEAQVVDYDGTETSVTIEATYEGVAVTKIAARAFKGCTSITQIVIPDSVTEIGASAFEDCSGFTQFVIPNSVTIVGNNAFMNCTALTNVTIGSGVTSIGEGAFDYCTALSSITFNGTKAKWNKIDLPNSWLTQVQLVTKVTCTDGDVTL